LLEKGERGKYSVGRSDIGEHDDKISLDFSLKRKILRNLFLT